MRSWIFVFLICSWVIISTNHSIPIVVAQKLECWRYLAYKAFDFLFQGYMEKKFKWIHKINKMKKIDKPVAACFGYIFNHIQSQAPQNPTNCENYRIWILKVTQYQGQREHITIHRFPPGQSKELNTYFWFLKMLQKGLRNC